MAKSKIKKGFLIYLFLFLAIVLAFFVVVFFILLLNPDKSILGLKTFSSSKVYEIVESVPYAAAYETPQDQAEIDFSDINTINVNADYAQVTFVCDNERSKNAIYIINDVQGFTRSSNKLDFDFNVSIENGVIDIDLQENTGFLFLRKNVQVLIHLFSADSCLADGTTIEVVTQSGAVCFGGYNGTTLHDLNGANLNAKITTTTGLVRMSTTSNCTFSSLDIKTSSGTIVSYEQTPDDFYGQGNLTADNLTKGFFITGDSVRFDIGKGTFNNQSVVCSNEDTQVQFMSTSGYVSCDLVKGVVNLRCESGNYYFGTIYGLYCSNPSIVNTPIIRVDECLGVISALSMGGAKISISNFDADMIDISTTTGSVTLGNSDYKNLVANGVINVLTSSGAIRLYTSSCTDSSTLYSSSGNIDIIYYDKMIKKDLTAKTQTGIITFRVHSNASAVFYFENYDGSLIDTEETNRIECSFTNAELTNPFKVNVSSLNASYVYMTANLVTDSKIKLLINNYDL